MNPLLYLLANCDWQCMRFLTRSIKKNNIFILIYLPLCLQVGWYNSVLLPTLHLPYPDDSLAVVVLSTPSMFEQAFLPFMEQKGYQGLSDPIDQCVKHSVSSAVAEVSGLGLLTWLRIYICLYIYTTNLLTQSVLLYLSLLCSVFQDRMWMWGTTMSCSPAENQSFWHRPQLTCLEQLTTISSLMSETNTRLQK